MTGNISLICLIIISTIILCCRLPLAHASVSGKEDWPMLAHDPARTGATMAEVRPPFARKWYRLFPDEGLMAGIQPIIVKGKVFIGTMAGILHSIDSETGEDIWTFEASGAILHTCAVADDKVFFGSVDGQIYAVDALNGEPIWSTQTEFSVWNSPVVYENVVYIGDRGGKLYAINSDTGTIKWTASTGGSILSSPAIDIGRNRVYIGSEDMHVYAFDFDNGKQIWSSPKLPGVSFRGYHPVIAPDGSVMVTVAPAISLNSFDPILLDMVKEIFGNFASWRHTKEENIELREENFKKMEEAGTYEKQLDYIRERLTKQPAYQTFFVLNPENGEQKFIAPIVYAESMNGTGAPPIVAPDGKVIVKYQVLLRSRYQHYAPFLNVGYLNTSTGHITPIMDQSKTYGWHDSLLLIHDEQSQLTVGGRVLLNTHQDNVNGMDLDTLEGYSEPFCHNIHEPQPDEAVSIWAHILRDQQLPTGREWLGRGTAIYGGGSVIDTPVSIAGDSFYYIPTHEMNAGAAVIAYKMQADGTASQRIDPSKIEITKKEWERIQQLPWDWDILRMRRLEHTLKGLPEKIPGTRQHPLTKNAEESVAKIADSELDKFIWEIPILTFPNNAACSDLKADLSQQIKELISDEWSPLLFPAGKHPWEAYRFFTDPIQTLHIFAKAYPYLDPELQSEVRSYAAEMMQSKHQSGKIRSYYNAPPEELMQIRDDITYGELERLYPIWLWAEITGDCGMIKGNWQEFRELIIQKPEKVEEDCWNSYIAGLIAYCRIAEYMDDGEATENGLTAARKAMRERLHYEFAHTRGGLITTVPYLRTILGRWRHLTPEVGRLCADYAQETHQDLMNRYIDHHRPTWFLAWNIETMWRNECPFEFPTMSTEVFGARALILSEPAEELRKYLDLPWCKADLFYIHKLILCIEAYGELSWQSMNDK